MHSGNAYIIHNAYTVNTLEILSFHNAVSTKVEMIQARFRYTMKEKESLLSNIDSNDILSVAICARKFTSNMV